MRPHPLRMQWHCRFPSPWHPRTTGAQSPCTDGQAGQGAALFDSPFQNVPIALGQVSFVLFCYVIYFCFPNRSETFSFVLTGEDGSRRFGYCRRLLVSNTLLLVCQSSGQPWAALGPGASPCATREEAGNVTGSSVELNAWKIWGFIEILLEEGKKNSVSFRKKIHPPLFPLLSKRPFCP